MNLEPSLQNAGFMGWRNSRAASGTRVIPEETAVAFSYNRMAHAVMMATPADLEDFAVGFSLNERIVDNPDEISELDVVPSAQGIELRMWIDERGMDRLLKRRRRVAGVTGCGLCGLETLEAAMRPPPLVHSSLRVGPQAILSAMAALASDQRLNHQAHALHAAAFWMPSSGLVAVREDVGRHSALDKLAGCLAQRNLDTTQGVLLLTSRVSIELVQKAAVMGVGVLAAISAPTALALRNADQAGMTLIGIARDDGFEVYTHATRVMLETAAAA